MADVNRRGSEGVMDNNCSTGRADSAFYFTGRPALVELESNTTIGAWSVCKGPKDRQKESLTEEGLSFVRFASAHA